MAPMRPTVATASASGGAKMGCRDMTTVLRRYGKTLNRALENIADPESHRVKCLLKDC